MAPRPRRAPKAAKAAPKRRLPLAAPRVQVPCLACGLCCTYIAVGIDGPVSAKSATEILWHLYHEGVSVYCDGDDEWMVQFESRCRHLLDDHKCAIYAQRPHICRDYSEKSCEVNAEGVGTTFYAPSEFLEYLAAKHKRIYKAIRDTHVPDAGVLGRAPQARRKQEPFEARFARLRAQGEPAAPPADRAAAANTGKAARAPSKAARAPSKAARAPSKAAGTPSKGAKGAAARALRARSAP